VRGGRLGFIFKSVLILIVFAFVIYVLKAITRLSHHLRVTIRDVKDIREKVSNRATASAEMVRCFSCGAFVSAREAVSFTPPANSRMFCSSECARSHIAK
jgi:formylmethanofuran dehydrogenase subunit E